MNQKIITDLKNNPTLITALLLNDRVMWDDILEPFHHYTLTDLTGPSIEEAISLAYVNNSPPKIIILPWFLAVLLIDYEHTKWVKNPFDNFLSPYSAGNLSYQTWGYLGTYLGAELYASSVTEDIWITTESDPSKIDGNNTVFITLDGKIEND